MAMRISVLGTPGVVKSSGGIPFLSGAAPWMDKPEVRPAGVVARNEAFTKAVVACTKESPYKRGTVWGKSDRNICIGNALAGRRKAEAE